MRCELCWVFFFSVVVEDSWCWTIVPTPSASAPLQLYL